MIITVLYWHIKVAVAWRKVGIIYRSECVLPLVLGHIIVIDFAPIRGYNWIEIPLTARRLFIMLKVFCYHSLLLRLNRLLDF